MKKSKAELEREIGGAVANFLQTQLGEQTTSVVTFLFNNTLVVCATNCLTPSERNLVQDKNDWNLLQQFKAQQFDAVKLMLKQQLEEITECEVLSIASIIGQDGVCFVMVTLGEGIEQMLVA